MAESLIKDKVTLCCGDSWHFLRDQPDNRYDSCVTDPPYALVSIVKRFGGKNAAPAKGNEAYMRASAGFMGKQWDTGESAHSVEFWAEVLRVLKPGGHVVAFASTRTYHRLACAIEDAGFEIRDMAQWLYGTGFNKKGYIFRDEEGKPIGPWGGSLKPANEPIAIARKPLSEKTIIANIERWGTGAINVDGCRIEGEVPAFDYFETGSKRGYDGGIKGGSRTGEKRNGRWPANVVHDGSDEVLAAFPIVGDSHPPDNAGSIRTNQIYGADNEPRTFHAGFPDSGSAARFFYQAKADDDDRLGSKHPTVKPVNLMQWLVRLVTPPGGLVLDPFAGTGTTAEACFREGMRCMLIERESEYQACIRRRMRLVMAGPEERRRESIKAKNLPVDHGPLFGGTDESRGGGRQITESSRTNNRPDGIEAVTNQSVD
jgi:site-specific DNA-methyltransferase (adenine-specific)